MSATDYFLLLFFAIAAGIAWFGNRLLVKIARPAESTKRFLLYLILLINLVFIIILLFGITVACFRNFVSG